MVSVAYSSFSNHDRRFWRMPVGGAAGGGGGRGKRRCGVGAGDACGGGTGRVSAARQASTEQGARRRSFSKLGVFRAARTSAPCAAQKSSVATSSSLAAATTASSVCTSTAEVESLPPAGSSAEAASTQSNNRATTWPGSMCKKRAIKNRGAYVIASARTFVRCEAISQCSLRRSENTRTSRCSARKPST